MMRRFIPLSKLDMFDEFHYETPDGFGVNQKIDGNTTEYHVEGVERIKKAIEKGCKTLPILVMEDGNRFKLLDGFKRAYAHKELHLKHIEAFVATNVEVAEVKHIPFQKATLVCYKGGLRFEDFDLFEGAESDKQDYETTKFLYKSPHGDGLRIEVSECIHVHHGIYGRYRLSLGRRDFEILAKAVSSIII